MKENIEMAKEARAFSYAPYSKYNVGAVLKTKSGKTYKGCNIENSGIQSICAERTAFAKAISEGEKDFESITIVGGEAGKNPTDECVPCGYCRQFMNEFVDQNFKIYTTNGKETIEYKMDELLPHSFKLKI